MATIHFEFPDDAEPDALQDLTIALKAVVDASACGDKYRVVIEGVAATPVEINSRVFDRWAWTEDDGTPMPNITIGDVAV